MTQRAAIYDRVSDDQDGRSRSVGQQGTENQAAADEHGWSVTARYADPDRSASRFARRDRDDWPRLMEALRAKRLDVVILWESSRGDRKLTEWSAFLDECRERGVLIHVTSHGHTYDLSRARDWKTLAEEGVSNAYSSEETSLRIKRDLADAAARGIPHGRLPYGYTRRYDPQTRELVEQVPDPATSPVAREIITRIAQGDAISAIQRDLLARQIPSPTGQERWARSTIVRLVLEGVCYISKRRHNGGPLLDGNWPSVIDEETYWRAVAVLKDPKRKTQAEKRGGIRPGAAKWLLSHIATCSVCGAGLGMQHRPRKGQMVPMYRCSSSHASHAYAPVDWMDFLVTEAVIRWCSRPGMYEAITGKDGRAAQAARDEADAERARLAEFEAQAISGKLSADSFARIAAGIEPRIADLDQKARDADVPPALRGLIGSQTDREADIRERWEGMPLAAQRSVIQTICAPTLAPTGRQGDPLSPWRVKMHFMDANTE